MKKFEELTKEELWELRGQVCLGSLYTKDYVNHFGFNENSVFDFFDGFCDYVGELAEEKYGRDNYDWNDAIVEYDNADALWNWYGMYDDFDWVEYD